MSYITRSFLALFLICYSSHVLADSPGASGPGVNVAMDEIVVSAQRLVDSISSGVYSRQTIDRDDLNGPSLGLDDVLRRVPGFGLFRRQASRAAHPTTQGVSLRGLGPNGAGRTLVLLDGMPLNDPFGGWVEWVNLPPSYIEQASVVRGGGAGTWGNSALAGVVRLDSRQLIGNSLSGDVRVGSKSSLSGSVQAQGSIADGLVTALAHHAQTDGYYLLSSEQRGEADRRAARNSEGARLSWRTAPY
jgi:vitamin B12 transporter